MAEQELEILTGTIGAVVFQNYDNGYAVLRLRQGKEAVTVVGTIPMPIVGEQLMVTGRWTSHPNHGRQFEAEFLERLLPQSSNAILHYLSGRVIKGIGPKTAQRIVEQFGDETLLVMEREPERLAEVPGISREKALSIGQDFVRQMGVRHLMEFFAAHQLPMELALRTYKLYGDQASDMLSDDPYLLTEDGMDAPFPAVDRFAVELGVTADDPRRVESGILFELKHNLTEGHCFLPREQLEGATAQLLTVSAEVVGAGIQRLCEYGRLAENTVAGRNAIYLPQIQEAESYCSMRLLQAAKQQFPPPGSLKAMLKQAASSCAITYSPQQEQAISLAATSGLLLITGGPGTGKTTILRGVLSLLSQMKLKCVLAAPTGRAAKRLTEVTGEDASTIHRLLEAGIDPNTGQMVFVRDEDNPLKADVVIVDEMSMVDISLLHSLLRAVPPGKRLVFVGDPDQLPPVGPGFPFSDCLRSKQLPTVALTEIFRQAQESMIVTNAHRVNQGLLPETRRVDRDFFFLRGPTEEQTCQTIVNLVCNRLPNKMGIPADQIQVLTPTRKGVTGTWNLNRCLQQALNPPSPEKKERPVGEYAFREGDRVMQIRNNYDIVWKKTDGSAVGTGIFNGDIGTIRTIDPGEETVTVVFDDREADYDFSQLGELEPAYALTVHKSQGSEYRAVVMSVWGASPYLLKRSILYTGITRARELLILVGREQTVVTMVENAKRNPRYTGLKLRLEGKCT